MAARPGLTATKVVDAAVAVVDRDGLDGLALGRVAAELGVRTPSLYNHVGGLDDLRRLLTVRALEDLGAALRGAAVGRSGADALRALAAAQRSFARDHPGLYATTVPSTEVDDEQVRAAGQRVVDVVLACLAPYGLEGDEAIHAARSLRAAVHGFLALELAGGFGLAVDRGTSFAWLVDRLVDGLSSAPRPSPSSVPTTGRAGR